ncbi:aminotransferase class V [Solidesulfovibrio fructosivorans JJ]]|uniref:Aminotransferase class V n=1 Tax=Solidesulfovibrio fructosivorans JJ] TaxID=596151 RepID=E1JUM5_SOLFR|nr:aminotransferase class V-fold PLP-dependent enzyme [Solidesulfovibrio fructosivorans]EFL51789.1 aminotransferase class V [Solidesulfovibrio fructosivorans JJ]]
MPDAPFPGLKLFITGPTYIRPEVRAAAAWPEFGHRDAENAKRFRPIFEDLAAIADLPQDYKTILFLGSGSTAMEAAIRSLVAADETVLHVSVGAFGDMWHKISLENGKNAALLAFEPGRAADVASIEAAMDEHKPAVVAITHNETSTGVANDVVALCRAVKARGALPIVDGVSIFGGAPTGIRESGCAMYCTATQKSLGLHAGFGIGFVSPEAVDKAKHVTARGHASDILSHLGRAAKFQTQSTPNGALGNQMFVQLEYIVKEEGIAARFARHEAMRDMALDFVAAEPGLAAFAQEGFRSPTVTTAVAPEGTSFADLKDVKETMRAKGYLFDPGYAKLNEDLEAAGKRPIFRIGHMGDISPDMLRGFLDALGEALAGR